MVLFTKFIIFLTTKFKFGFGQFGFGPQNSINYLIKKEKYEMLFSCVLKEKKIRIYAMLKG